MSTYTQQHRIIGISTPLKEDALLLQSFSGEEGVSVPFRFDLRLHSEDRNIKFDAVVGQPATVRINLADGSARYINGIISQFTQGGASQRFAHYSATLVPWLWLLTRTSDCRIFQNKSAIDIIQQIFKEYGFADYRLKLQGAPEEREYCVQYRETDFNFVSRLLEEEGIFYFFEHEESKHTLVLANSQHEFKDCPDQATARYEMVTHEHWLEDLV
ncbi:MAG: type VI secretion system tip protein TssI/VgrG, partial [Pyrinomonadaceae bacterium]